MPNKCKQSHCHTIDGGNHMVNLPFCMLFRTNWLISDNTITNYTQTEQPYIKCLWPNTLNKNSCLVSFSIGFSHLAFNEQLKQQLHSFFLLVHLHLFSLRFKDIVHGTESQIANIHGCVCLFDVCDINCLGKKK